MCGMRMGATGLHVELNPCPRGLLLLFNPLTGGQRRDGQQREQQITARDQQPANQPPESCVFTLSFCCES